MASPRSRSSSSSTSSLSSTFSDTTSSTSASSSSPPKPKTLAFFASPFSSRPDLQVSSPSKVHSTPKAADSFSTPRPSSPPLSFSKTSKSLLFPSRVFPSWYASATRKSLELRFDDTELLSSFPDNNPSHIDNARLPTPPLLSPKGVNRDAQPPSSSESLDFSTPRPPHSGHSHSLLLAPPKSASADQRGEISISEITDTLEPGSIISIPWSNVAPTASPSPAAFLTVPLPATDAGSSHTQGHGMHRSPTPKVGDISSLSADHAHAPGRAAPSSSSSLSSLYPKIDAEAGLSISNQSSSELRLLRLLGHGAFSSVWLGEDFGRLPLTQLSKRSVRDLRRRASGRQKMRKSDPLSEDDIIPFPAKHEGAVGAKHLSGRLSEGWRNMLSLTRPRSSPTSSGNAQYECVDSLQRHPTLPSHSPSSSISGDDMLGSLPSVPPSPYSSNLTLPPSPISLNFHGVHGGGQASTLSRDSSLRKFRERVKGTRPAFCLGRAFLDERDGRMGSPMGAIADEFGFLSTGEENQVETLSRRSSLGKSRDKNERLVAIKITPRRTPGSAKEEEERTRVRFVREVEVLKHISHPNITPLLAHLSSPHHHILILPYLPGGDLLALVNSDIAWGKLTESMVRRMWCELCKAVGWMHGVGLVHRDIKLENILLATTAFTELTPDSLPLSPSISPPSSSLIKLADFGLSRFVEIDEITGEAELLTTRCGSEAYAAPELVTGGRAGYDARKTDAWACGVVLYALVGRKLPFGEGVPLVDDACTRRIGGEKDRQTAITSVAARRHWLMTIARGEWVWPGEGHDSVPWATLHDDNELVGPTLRESKGSRRIVEKLLVRDPRKRARIVDLWENDWMCGGVNEVWREHEGHQPPEERAPSLHVSPPVIVRDFAFDSSEQERGPVWVLGDRLTHGPSLDEEQFDDEDDEGGILLDHEGIDSITRQEVI